MGVGEIVDFRHLSRYISETVQDMVQVAITSSKVGFGTDLGATRTSV